MFAKVPLFSIIAGLLMVPKDLEINYERAHIVCKLKGNYALGNHEISFS